MAYTNLLSALDQKIEHKKEIVGARTVHKFTMKLPPHPDFQDLPVRFSQLYTEPRFSEAGITITVSSQREGGDTQGIPRFMTPAQWNEFTVDPASPALLAKAIYRLVDDTMLQMSTDFMNWRERPCRGDLSKTNGEWLDAVRRQKAEVAGQPSLRAVDAYIHHTTGKDVSEVGRNARSKMRNAARKAMSHA